MFKKSLIGDILAVVLMLGLLRIAEAANPSVYMYIIVIFIGVLLRAVLKKWFPVINLPQDARPYEKQAGLVILILFIVVQAFAEIDFYLSLAVVFVALEVNAYIFYKRKQKKSTYLKN